MIIDNLKNGDLYSGINPKIGKALAYLKSTDFSGLASGKYEIDGTEMYAIVQEYFPKPVEDCLWEAHRKYIDIQYIAEGRELMGYCNIEKMEIKTEYDEDIDFMELKGNGTLLKVEKDTFVIFMPQDVHMPGIRIESSINIKKVVVKVSL